MFRKCVSVFALLFLFSVSFVCLAQTQPATSDEITKDSDALDQAAAKAGNEKTYQTLSSQLGIPVETLRTQQADSKFGFGNLFIANALAKASGKDFTTIAQQFQAGQGWGSIAKANGLKLGTVVSQIKRSTKAVEREPKAPQTIETAGSHEKAVRSPQSGHAHANASGHGRK